MKLSSIFSILIALMSFACGRSAQVGASLMTDQSFVDLGAEGNRDVANVFSAYSKKASGCKAAKENEPRVLLTGFGLFAGVPFNISGKIVGHLAQDLRDGALNPLDHGGRAINREINIGNKTVAVCFLQLEVKWDLAAAITTFEMQRFGPDLVVMTGVTGEEEAFIEGGAMNSATSLSGFSSSGKEDPKNLPVSDFVLPDVAPADMKIHLTWDNQKIFTAIQPMISEMGFSVSAPTEARDGNDYICNNITYVVQTAALGRGVELAGGSVVLPPKLLANPKVGFFHYPATATSDSKSLSQWSAVILKLIEVSI